MSCCAASHCDNCCIYSALSRVSSVYKGISDTLRHIFEHYVYIHDVKHKARRMFSRFCKQVFLPDISIAHYFYRRNQNSFNSCRHHAMVDSHYCRHSLRTWIFRFGGDNCKKGEISEFLLFPCQGVCEKEMSAASGVVG